VLPCGNIEEYLALYIVVRQSARTLGKKECYTAYFEVTAGLP